LTTQTLKIGRQEFVVIPKREFDQLRARADGKSRGSVGDAAAAKRRKATARAAARDRRDIELARERLADPNDRRIPYLEARKDFGLD
jgi:hypothetical protein